MKSIKKQGRPQLLSTNWLETNRSALYAVWQAYIMHKRGYDKEYDLFRLKGGNQVMTNEFARRLGSRVKLDCQILEVKHSDGGVTLNYTESGEQKTYVSRFFCKLSPNDCVEKHFFYAGIATRKTFCF